MLSLRRRSQRARKSRIKNNSFPLRKNAIANNSTTYSPPPAAAREFTRARGVTTSAGGGPSVSFAIEQLRVYYRIITICADSFDAKFDVALQIADSQG